jgi:hypothetical protein
MTSAVKKNVLIVLASLLSSLLCAEILLRVVQVPNKVASGWSWYGSPRRVLARYPNDSTNQLGFRGQPIVYGKDDYVVVLLGDSQVEAATSAPDKMPEKLLQNNLAARLHRPVQVFSLGASGYGQDQELLALVEYYKKYRADLVLVWATPGNDFFENAFPDHSTTRTAGHLKPTFKLVNDQLQGPYYPCDFYYHGSALLHLVAKAYAGYRGISLEQVIVDNWLRELPPSHKIFENIDLHETCAGSIPIPDQEYSKSFYSFGPGWTFVLSTDEDFYNSRSHFSLSLTNRSPRDNYLVAITQKLYARIRETAKANGSTLRVFFTDRIEETSRDLEFVRCVQYKTDRSTARTVRLDSDSRLKAVTEANELLHVQLSGRTELSVSSTDAHLSDTGNIMAMARLAQLLPN